MNLRQIYECGDMIKKEIAPSIRKISKYWLDRQDEFEFGSPVQDSEPTIGRNDLCPCGSGKKYKKCCLN